MRDGTAGTSDDTTLRMIEAAFPGWEVGRDARSAAEVAAAEAEAVANRAKWDAEAKTRADADAERQMLEAAGKARPTRPFIRSDGMSQEEYDIRAPSTMAHSEWYHLRQNILWRLESHHFAERLLATGWTWYPQNREGTRKAILCGASDEHGVKFRKTGPLADGPADYCVVGYWEAYLSSTRTVSTVAALYCGHGGTWALDSDLERPEWAATLRRVAEEHLGPTRFVRGRYNSHRYSLLYRMAPGETLPRMSTIRLVASTDDDGAIRTQDIEWKGPGNSITLLGRHSSGVPYAWEDLIPGLDARPEDLPTVTADQVRSFAEAINEAFADVLYRPARALGPAREYVLTDADGHGDLRSTATARPDDRGRGWTLGADGRVSDGRDTWALHHLMWLVGLNRSRLAEIVAGYGTEDEGVAAAQAVVLRRFALDVPAHAQDGGKHGHDELVENADRGRQVARAWDYVWNSPRANEPKVVVREDGTAVVVQEAVVAATTAAEALAYNGDEDLAGLLPGVEPPVIKGVTLSVPDPALAAAHARPADRTATHAHVADVVKGGIEQFLLRGVSERSLLMLLKAPTGAGKSSTLLEILGAMKVAGTLPGPVAFLVPSFALIDDLQKRFDAKQVWVAGRTTEAEAAGLRVMTYKSAIHYCHEERRAKMAALRKVGVPTGGLCRGSKRGEDGEYPTCPHYLSCGATLQKLQVPQSDVVFLPAAYLTVQLPKVLREDLFAVVVDEAVHDQLVVDHRLMPGILITGRRDARLTIAEQSEKTTVHDLMREREIVGQMAINAILADRPVPEYLFGLDHRTYDGRDVRAMVATAERVCSDAARPGEVTPDIDLAKAQRMKVGEQVWQEWRFWKVVGERMDALRQDVIANALLADVAAHRVAMGDESPLPVVTRRAKGDFDTRLQVLDLGRDGSGRPVIEADTRIRISHRSEPNWSGVPTLLMDASADVAITRKLWPGRSVEVVEVRTADARHHTRVMWCPESTFSDHSLLPYKYKVGSPSRYGAENALARIRHLLEGVCNYYGHGQVACYSTLGVELALLTAWQGARNLSTAHHGALVGLDAFRDFDCHVVVGRQEPPIPALDSMGGALGYDDDEPEMPYDLRGDGQVEVDGVLDDLRLPFITRTVAMADGSDATYSVPAHPGAWARRAQELVREQGVAQAIGRARPMYKDGASLPPLVLVLGRALPEGLVVDAITTVEALLKRLSEVAPLRWTPMMLSHEVFRYAQDTPSLRAGVPATDGRPGPFRP